MRGFTPIFLKRRPAWRWTLRALVLLLASAVVGYPWILDRVGRALLARQGVEIESADAGYGGVVWRGLEFGAPGWHLAVDALQIDSPPRLLFGTGSAGSAPLHAQGVRITLHPTGEDSDQPAPSVAGVVDSVGGVLRLLERWLPVTEMKSVEVELAKGAITAQRIQWRAGRAIIEQAEWSGKAFMLRGEAWSPTVRSLSLERWSDRLHLELALPEGERLRADIGPTAEGVQATLSARWRDGLLDGAAAFAESGWLPVKAQLKGEATALPAQWSSAFSEWTPNLRWQSAYDGARGQFSVSLDGSGMVPQEDASRQPLPWNASIEAEGDAEAIIVKALKVDVPFLQANLNHALLLDRASLRPAEAVELSWSLDLAAIKQPGFQGDAKGLLTLEPNEALDGARFALRGEGRNFSLPMIDERLEMESLAFSAAGLANLNAVEVEAYSLRLAKMGEVSGAVRWDRATNLIGPFSATGQVEAETIGYWLDPAKLATPKRIVFAVEGAQDAAGWAHTGRLDVAQFVVAGAWPAAAKISWRGRDATLEHWAFDLQRPDAQLEAEGSVRAIDGGHRVALEQIREVRSAGEAWHLVAPATIDWVLSTNEGPVVVSLSSLQLARGDEGVVELNGRWAGWNDLFLQTKIRGVSPDDAAPWLEQTVLPAFSASAVDVELTTVDRPDGSYAWRGRGEIDATWVSPRQRAWIGRGGWQLEDDRVRFDDVRLQTEGTTWLQLQGTAPFGLRGTTDSILKPEYHENGAIDLLAVLEPVDRLPQPLEEKLPFTARAFHGRLHAQGTLREPAAQLEVYADQLTWLETETREAIVLRDLALQAVIEAQRVELKGLTLRLAEAESAQTISGAIGDIDWTSWMKDPRAERWLELSGNLKLAHWPVASLGRWLPTQLEPNGSVTMEMAKRVDQWPEGEVNWEGLTSQPLADGLVARQIAGSAQLRGQRLEGLEVTGTIGGQPWGLTGWIDAEDAAGLRFRLALEADRLDLVRRADLILRGKATLEAVREDLDKPAMLRGEFKMLRSLFLQDLQDFTRQGAAGVARRPPYFSVESGPFADWALDVRLIGDQFLQIRSTVLVGEASANFHLGGTLGAPLLVGEAWLDRGTLRFPFAQLPASRLQGRITTEEPHVVQLSGQGEGVAYGYVVNYQLSGTSEDPELVFSSLPSLSQDDILLMIATGAVPSSEIASNSTVRAGRLALYLGQDIFSEWFGQDGARRIEIRSGDGFSPFHREGQVIEYRLDDQWSILGEYDDFGGYNVDLKRRLLKR